MQGTRTCQQPCIHTPLTPTQLARPSAGSKTRSRLPTQTPFRPQINAPWPVLQTPRTSLFVMHMPTTDPSPASKTARDLFRPSLSKRRHVTCWYCQMPVILHTVRLHPASEFCCCHQRPTDTHKVPPLKALTSSGHHTMLCLQCTCTTLLV